MILSADTTRRNRLEANDATVQRLVEFEVHVPCLLHVEHVDRGVVCFHVVLRFVEAGSFSTGSNKVKSTPCGLLL